MINWPFGGKQKEKIERYQGETIFKGASMVVEKSSDGQNENWKVPVKIHPPSLEGLALQRGIQSG